MEFVGIISAFLLAVSLCADCFAVCSCSSVTLESINRKKVCTIALAFSVVHISFMFTGWLFGDLFAGLVGKVADIIGFLLMLYVGGSMIAEAVKDKSATRNLNGLRNILICAVATSLDAFAVGISQSMDHCSPGHVLTEIAVLFAVTFVTVALAIAGGYRIGRRVGRPAEIAGGCILVLIGLNILFKFI